MKEKVRALARELKRKAAGKAGKAMDRVAARTGLALVRDPLRYASKEDELTLNVPGYRQTETFSCGFVAGLMVVHTFHPKASLDAFYQRVSPTRARGTPTSRLVPALRAFSLGVGVRFDLGFKGLEKAIKGGYPIIVAIRTKDPKIEHWIVVYGIGTKPQRVFVAGAGVPLFSRKVMPWVEFRAKWPQPREALVCWGR